MLRRLRVVAAPSSDLGALRGRTLAVVGYGSQGHAHALNLRDSGATVIVAQRRGGPRFDRAVADGFEVVDVATATRRADLLILGVPDESLPAIFSAEIAPHLRPGQALGFLHGFNLHYHTIALPPAVDAVLVAPKAQGHAVRSEYVAGRGVAALIAVQQDASGAARDVALGWAAGIGCARSAIYETTFADETETDLFGEQAVLCGGLTALLKAAFDTLVDAGYPAELAYFECCHEVKIIADLIHAHGITAMRERISNTARYGDLTRGPRIIDARVRATLREVLDDIRSGRFAHEWLAESAAGRPHFTDLTERDRQHAIEQVGTAVRARLARPTT